ncbi:MAG: D-alanine--D-alanine ligase [Clostridia bacterium]|nr:D-alanine--D-alanine ligase [Clostridia bacterium]
MNIVVLAGGWSTEREVSLTSGSLIANALIEAGHRVVLVDTYLGIDPTDDVLSLFRNDQTYCHSVSTEVPDLARLRAQSGNGDALVGRGVLEVCLAADLVFNAMHGGMGEDGTVQAWLDCYGIRYTGTGALGAALSMDKEITKRLLCGAGIDTPRGIVVCPHRETDGVARVLREVGLPCVVKPAAGGSSVGVSIVEDEAALTEALSQGAAYDERLVVEHKIEGRELTVGILGERVLPPIEIIPHSGFYDYHNKYQGGCATELCPAPLTEEQTACLQEATARGFAALHLQSHARFDYIMDADGRMWCLEANALPGMTPTSLLPQMAAAIGIDYVSLCEEIVRLAFEK